MPQSRNCGFNNDTQIQSRMPTWKWLKVTTRALQNSSRKAGSRNGGYPVLLRCQDRADVCSGGGACSVRYANKPSGVPLLPAASFIFTQRQTTIIRIVSN